MSTPDDVASSLIDSLASEATHVDEGSFTLDPAKAREKLRAYQLADAHEWILLAISAGYVATGGRGPVHVQSGRRASVRFTGVRLSAAALEHCFAAVFGRERELEGDALIQARVLRLLGLAANAALSLEARVEIESVDASGQRHALRVSPDGAQVLERVDNPDAELGTRITVHRGSRRTASERELVAERCLMTSAAILLDDEHISQGPTFVMPIRRTDVTLDGAVIGKASFETDRTAPAKALIINRGVLAETVTLVDCSDGFVAIVDVDLPTDLSQRQILRDETWSRLLASIKATHDALPRPPRFNPGGLPSEGDHQAQSTTATIIVVALIGSAFFVFVLLKWILRDALPAEPDYLTRGCEQGDPLSCSEAIAKTNDPKQLRALWRRSCELGNNEHCLLHAEADPEASFAVLFEACRAGLVQACSRALLEVQSPRTAAELEHAWCYHSREYDRCRSWVEDAKATCEDASQCVALRELLRGECMGDTAEFCLEAGWMTHLGYGGAPDSEAARVLFARACGVSTKNRAACHWKRQPTVSEQACADRDAWACYSLGYSAYHSRRDVEASVEYFERACELRLAAGCSAAELARTQQHPPIAFPSYDPE